MTDMARGLTPDHRYRCNGCGNVTRFDVVATTRSRTFYHYDLGGTSEVEDEEILSRDVESVTCHWCNRSDAIVVEPAHIKG